jgi:hypothetical protein
MNAFRMCSSNSPQNIAHAHPPHSWQGSSPELRWIGHDFLVLLCLVPYYCMCTVAIEMVWQVSVLCQDSACLHTNAKKKIYIYIYIYQRGWNILEWRAVLSKWNMQGSSMCRDIVAAFQGDPPDNTLHPLLSLVGLFFQLLSSPTFHFWDPTRVYLDSCGYLLDHSTTWLGATSN